ncbi:MAG TPA: hypothetical protein VL326_37630 [Kofleriaceae bacterium]|jgi:hypothetical protein|nr:hypothetical protein [Kofleriaceae bacterium]
MKRALLAAALAAVTLGGCYSMTFQLQPGPVAATPSPEYDNHFHFNLINLIEISSEVDLNSACGGNVPAAIEEDVGVLGAIANIALSYVIPILSVHNATVMCGVGGAPMGAPMGPPMGQPGMDPNAPQPMPQQ